jgi:hypothetical protein
MSENKNGVPVMLAGRDFVVKRIPMARVRSIGKTLSSIIGDFNTKDLNKSDNVAEILLDKVLEFPYEILSLFIKDLPKEIFEDENEGVNFPEFLDALKVAIEVNRIDTLKNFFTRLAPMMLQAQASLLQKGN